MDLVTLALAKKYTDEKVGTGGGSNASIQIDSTLSQSGAAADAKIVGDALAKKPDEERVKQLINQAFESLPLAEEANF